MGEGEEMKREVRFSYLTRTNEILTARDYSKICTDTDV